MTMANEKVEDLEDEVDELKAHNESLMEGRARRKERMAELRRENERLKGANQHALSMLAMVLLSVPGKRVVISNRVALEYDHARTRLCTDRLLSGDDVRVWVEVDNNKETRDERERYPCGKPKLDRVSASQIFKEGEVKVLSSILDALLRGSDARQATRSPDFAGLARKTSAMKRRIEQKR